MKQPHKNTTGNAGFTLVEIMIIVTMIAVLSAIAVNSFHRYFARSKRPEVYLTLNAISQAQEAYYLENDAYSLSFNALQFTMDVGYIESDTELNGQYYTYRLSQPYGTSSWYCVATANIDEDDWLDIVVAGRF